MCITGIVSFRVLLSTRGRISQNVALMNLLDEQYTRTPFYGIRKMQKWLRTLGHVVNKKRVGRLMRIMGLETIYPKPRLSIGNVQHKNIHTC